MRSRQKEEWILSLSLRWQPNALSSGQKVPEESANCLAFKPWKTRDNSPPSTVAVIPQAVGTGETDQFSPSLSLRSTTYRLQKQSVQRGFELISPVSTGPTTAVLVVLLRE